MWPGTRPRDLALRWSRSKEPPTRGPRETRGFRGVGNTGLSVFDIRAGRSAEACLGVPACGEWGAGGGPHKPQRSGRASGRTSKVGCGVWRTNPADLRRDLRLLNSLRAARNRARSRRPCVGAPQPAARAHRALRSEPRRRRQVGLADRAFRPPQPGRRGGRSCSARDGQGLAAPRLPRRAAGVGSCLRPRSPKPWLAQSHLG